MNKEQLRDKNGRFKKMSGQEAPNGKTKTVTFELHHCGDKSKAEQIKFERDVFKNLSENLASKNISQKMVQKELNERIETLESINQRLLSCERYIRELYNRKDRKIAIALSYLKYVIASHSFIFNKRLKEQLKELSELIKDSWYV